MSSVSVCESGVGPAVRVGGGRGHLYRSFKSWLFLLFLRSTLKIRGAPAPLSTSSRAFKASKTSASRSTDRTGAPPGCTPLLVLIPLIPPPRLLFLILVKAQGVRRVGWVGERALGAVSVPLAPLFVLSVFFFFSFSLYSVSAIHRLHRPNPISLTFLL